MWEHFKCFSVEILDYYNTKVHSLVCNKLSSIKTVEAPIRNFCSYKNNYRIWCTESTNKKLLHMYKIA